uniref:CSON008092 protein n=1 Tax=Culicoides sonorensis TaxID=179676 RepID=A0A336LYH0_CULSO
MTEKFGLHSEKVHLEKSKRIIDLFTDCGGTSPGMAIVAPIKMPIHWKQVLRLGSGQRINVDELLLAAEAGNLDDFVRLYQGDNTRLNLKDGKGRTAAHQAASRNRINILQFILDHDGEKLIFLIILFQTLMHKIMWEILRYMSQLKMIHLMQLTFYYKCK